MAAIEYLPLTEDPLTWMQFVRALRERIRREPVRSVNEGGAVLEVLAVLRDLEEWCAGRAGVVVDDA